MPRDVFVGVTEKLSNLRTLYYLSSMVVGSIMLRGCFAASGTVHKLVGIVSIVNMVVYNFYISVLL